MTDSVLAALLALARTMDNNSPTLESDVAMLEALSGHGDVSALRQAKNAIVPSCRSCQHPCGRTSEPDIAYLKTLPTWESKMALLERLASFSRKPLDSKKFTFLYRALFHIGEDWVEEGDIESLDKELMGF